MILPLYQIAAYRFTLAINGPEPLIGPVTDALHRVLEGFRRGTAPLACVPAGDPARTPIEAGHLDCWPGAGWHHLAVTLDPAVQEPDPMGWVHALEPAITNHAIQHSPGHLWIHGACARHGDALTLLVADSGVGKTTLSLGLLAYDYRLLTDDIFLLNLATRRTIPVPRAPRLRPPADVYLTAAGFNPVVDAAMLDNFVVLPPERIETRPLDVPLARVILLRRDADQPPERRDLPLMDGVVNLLGSSNLAAVDPDLTQAHDLFAGTRFIAMNLRDYPADLAAIAAGRV